MSTSNGGCWISLKAPSKLLPWGASFRWVRLSPCLRLSVLFTEDEDQGKGVSERLTSLVLQDPPACGWQVSWCVHLHGTFAREYTSLALPMGVLSGDL